MVWLLMLLVKTAFAQPTAPLEAKLLNQSTTGQTVVFNLGTHDNVKIGDFAIILKKIRPMYQRDLRITPAAKARVVKVNTDSSIWILYKLIDPKLMVKNDKFLILTESHLLNGRRPIEVKKTSVVSSKGSSMKDMKSAINHDNERLTKLSGKYESSDPLHGKEDRQDGDFDLLNLEEWEKRKGDGYRTALYRSPDRESFRRQFRLETFEKLVTGYLKKVNDPDFNYDAFYDDQMRDNFSNEFKKSSSMQTEYKEFLANESVRKKSDAKLYRSILEKGESWSEDFSDEELRERLNGVSVLQEKDRRLRIGSKPNRYLINLGYGLILNDTQISSDEGTRRKNRFDFSGSFEFSPFLGHQYLERFTLDGGARMDRNAFESGGSNVHYNETSLSVGANWYPLYASYVVQEPVIFLGAYFRSGQASVEDFVTGEKANYTVYSFPGFKAGLKYMFKNSYGLRIAASLETLNIDQYESSLVGGQLPASKKLVESKADIGFIYSF